MSVCCFHVITYEISFNVNWHVHGVVYIPFQASVPASPGHPSICLTGATGILFSLFYTNTLTSDQTRNNRGKNTLAGNDELKGCKKST